MLKLTLAIAALTLPVGAMAQQMTAGSGTPGSNPGVQNNKLETPDQVASRAAMTPSATSKASKPRKMNHKKSTKTGTSMPK